MTQKDIDNITRSWSLIVNDELANMLKFYNRLFEIAPQVRVYFPDDMSRLAEKLGFTLNLLVTNLGDFDKLRPTLEELGRFHRDLGVQNSHYRYVIKALLFTIKDAMDVFYSDEIGQSWKRALIAVSTIMIEGSRKKEKKVGLFAKLFGGKKKSYKRYM